MRTIESPGVEIKEIDLSFNTELPYGTTSLVVGYAKQGPTDELLNVTSVEELEQVYGLPENAAERYMYTTAKQILNANGNLLVTRLPYGSGDGEGYTTKYSALVYPYIPVDLTNPSSSYTELSGLKILTNKTIVTYTSAYIESVVAPNSLAVSTEFNLAEVNNLITVNEYTTANDTFKLNLYYGVSSFMPTITNTSYSGTLDFEMSGQTIALSSIASLNQPELSAYFVYAEMIPYTPNNALANQHYSDYNYVVSVSTNAPFTSATVSVDCSGFGGLSGVSFSSDEATHYYLGQPVHITIDEDTYFDWTQGGINWQSTVNKQGLTGLLNSDDDATILKNVGYGGLIIVNEAKTTITDQYEGYYVAIADNSKMDKGSNFDSVLKLKSFNQSSDQNDWVELNPQALSFSMTGSYYEHAGSVSEIVEGIPNFDFSNVGEGGFGDSLIVTLFKVRPSIYDQNQRVLNKVLYEAYVGSLDVNRTLANQNGGKPVNFYLEEVINKQSNNMKVFVNPYISRFSGTWYDTNNQLPTKFVRVLADERRITSSPDQPDIGIAPAQPAYASKLIFDNIKNNLGLKNILFNGDNLYGVGESVPCQPEKEKYIGNLPRKLERALRLAENYELLRLDLVPEAGLGTIWTGMCLDLNNYPADVKSRTTPRSREIFDDTVKIDGILNAHTFDKDSDGLLDQETGSASEASDLYETVAGILNQFCQFTRKDCLQIADPLRYIFVQGSGEVKVMDNKKLNFSQHIFWPLKNLFGGLNSSYICTYANWFKINDVASDQYIWAPPSGYIANLMVKTDTNFFPWYAPAGLTRGILSGILDIGINPTQKQRDLLYKNGINPTVYWPGDGYVIWGQKTLQKKPSAFDRVNVRRLFLWCEKAVLQIARYFVFEQNTPFTRNRLKAAIDPVLAFAKSNEGIYDYLIVCDERNNTPETIDRNELIVDIYIKPVRVAEFILINFIATRTGQRFDELI